MTEQTTSTANCVEQAGDRMAAAEVALIVNGAPMRSACATLAELLVALDFDAVGVATAVNGDFVPQAARGQHVLAAGDQIEILAPRQGG